MEKTKLKLSIIIAYYNAEKYVTELLDALLDQGFSESEFEIIVVDDESTHSVDVLKDYCAMHHNVKYVWQKNARQSAARNHGICLAQGEYLYFCDNDDKVNRGVLSHIYDVAHTNELEMLFFNRLVIGEHETPPMPHKNFKLDNEICTGQQYLGTHLDISTGPWHYIIRRDFVEKHHLKFPDGVIYCEDVDFLANASVVANKVSYVDVDVYYWVQRPLSISHYAGKKKMAGKYIGDMIWNVEQRKKQIADNPNLLPEFVHWIDLNNQSVVFGIVHNAFRYLPVTKNIEILDKLEQLGEYPLKKEQSKDIVYYIFSGVMNKRRLWLKLCSIFQMLPESIKLKF